MSRLQSDFPWLLKLGFRVSKLNGFLFSIISSVQDDL